MILIDTNVFLELLLNQKKARDCALLLDLVSKGEIEAHVTHFSVHAVEAVLERGDGLVAFLRNLENSKGLSVHDTSTSDEISVAILSDKIDRSFDDALQYYIAKKLGLEAIVSFDKHFDGLDVPRRDPSEVLAMQR